jgi:glucan phosphoethanolaminetransferase (alkaline phosphatase superfamily)
VVAQWSPAILSYTPALRNHVIIHKKVILNIVGWVLSYALLNGLIGPFWGTCTQGDDSPWVIGLIFDVPITAISFLLVAYGISAGRKLLCLAIPHVLTIIAAAYVLPFYFLNTTVKGIDVCSARESLPYDVPTTVMQRLWAPVFFMLLLTVCLLFWKQWQAENNVRVD